MKLIIIGFLLMVRAFCYAQNPVVVIREESSSYSTNTTYVYQRPSWQGNQYNQYYNPYATGLNVPMPMPASAIAPTPKSGSLTVNLPGYQRYKTWSGGTSVSYEYGDKIYSQQYSSGSDYKRIEMFPPKPVVLTKKFWTSWRKRSQ